MRTMHYANKINNKTEKPASTVYVDDCNAKIIN